LLKISQDKVVSWIGLARLYRNRAFGAIGWDGNLCLFITYVQRSSIRPQSVGGDKDVFGFSDAFGVLQDWDKVRRRTAGQHKTRQKNKPNSHKKVPAIVARTMTATAAIFYVKSYRT
jgi:hypothetical protein